MQLTCCSAWTTPTRGPPPARSRRPHPVAARPDERIRRSRPRSTSRLLRPGRGVTADGLRAPDAPRHPCSTSGPRPRPGRAHLLVQRALAGVPARRPAGGGRDPTPRWSIHLRAWAGSQGHRVRLEDTGDEARSGSSAAAPTDRWAHAERAGGPGPRRDLRRRPTALGAGGARRPGRSRWSAAVPPTWTTATWSGPTWPPGSTPSGRRPVGPGHGRGLGRRFSLSAEIETRSSRS